MGHIGTDGAALSERLFCLYALGVTPICLKNALLNVRSVLNPTISLISVTDLSVRKRYLQAFETRSEFI